MLCTVVDRERFSAFRADHGFPKPVHLYRKGLCSPTCVLQLKHS